MQRNDAFKVEGTVMNVLSGKTCRVELANGHRLLGFIAGKARLSYRPLASGQKVRLQLSPCDLSHGRILVEMATGDGVSPSASPA
jgi:translation initiation factor IF-1